MSMSTEVAGFIPPDDDWQKMKAAWDACQAAGVPVPREVSDFFGDEEPDPAGRMIELPVREWSGEMSTGYELDVSSIPATVKIIRFWNSY